MSIFVTSGSGDGASAASTGWEIRRAELEIEGLYGDTVSVASTNKSSHTFGRRTDATTAHVTCFDITAGDGVLASETYSTTNDITTIVSNNAGDTMQVTIEGHTISGSDLTFVTQTATLTGLTPVTLSTALARCNDIKVSSGTTANAGIISVYEGGALTSGLPDVGAGVHCQVAVGENQSEKGATSTSSDEYLLVTEVVISCHDTIPLEAFARLEIKSTSGVWLKCFEYSVSNIGTNTLVFSPHPTLIIPKNSDVRLICATSSGTMDATTASFNGHLASVLA